MGEKKLGLGSVVSISVGLVIATSCLVSLGQGAGSLGVPFIGAMVVAMLLNMTTVASLSELNALMPNITGGLAQYTLAALGPFPTLLSMVGGYLVCNTMSCGVEASIFSFAVADTTGLKIPSIFYTLVIVVVLLIANLYGVDMFAKIQNVVAFLLIGSLVGLGIIGMLGLGTGQKISQPYALNSSFKDVVSMTAVAFWLFIGAEYAIPVSKDVKNAKRNVPLGMILGLALICLMQAIMILGFHNYTEWGDLADSPAPHLLYGYNLLGNFGKVWMTLVGALAVISTQNSTVNSLAAICQGMAKMNMMPQIFAKTNKHNVPWFGQVFVSAAIFGFAVASNNSSEGISFLILVGSVFWMVSYILAHVDVLVFRKRLPKAPRAFKLPGGPVIPVIGIVGTVYMILNISTDPHERLMIWLLTGVTFLVLAVYSVFWIKVKMKMPVFKSVPMQKVMAMENNLYYVERKRRGIWK
nr:APC family permease [uncultured Lachnoclostridium sp.]